MNDDVQANHGQLLAVSEGRADASDRRTREDEATRAHAERAVRVRAEPSGVDPVALRDEFLAIASHELRTPLTALQLQLENLQAMLPVESSSTDPRYSLADKVNRALRHTQRLARLIDSMLAVSHMMAGRFTLQLRDGDLRAIANEVVERMRPDAERAGCRLSLYADAAVRGRWDALRIDQLLTNLLTNAFRYAPGADVRVSVSALDRGAAIAVQDGGPGIAREGIARIFERHEIAGERSRSGLGLGLYVVRQIAEAHGGSARVESEVGHGARFVVELPITGAMAKPDDAPAAREAGP